MMRGRRPNQPAALVNFGYKKTVCTNDTPRQAFKKVYCLPPTDFQTIL